MNANEELARILKRMQKEEGNVTEKPVDPYDAVTQKIDELDVLLKNIANDLADIGYSVGSVGAELMSRDENDPLVRECMEIQHRIFTLLEQEDDKTKP